MTSGERRWGGKVPIRTCRYRYTFTEKSGVERKRERERTDDGFPILLHLKRAFAVPDQKREVEQVLDGLRKVVRIDDESEKVYGTVLLHEQVTNLGEKKRN